ncbi:DUF72 domain-containing protein [Planctomycetota bacterium]
MPCPIHFGIAGWSYADWNGIVYTQPKLDQLAYISRYVDCIEINSSFYRPPVARNSESWLRRTEQRAGFFFTAKLHQSVTHAGQLDSAIVEQFHEGFAPLQEAGRLKHLLAQFRYDFADTSATRTHLRQINERFGETFDLVMELRHKSWESPAALGFLERLGVGVCNLDYPTSSNSFDLQQCTIGRAGYLRLHGRNHAAWFSKAGRDETYNYYYNPQELTQIKERLRQLADSFWYIVVIGNNHYKGAEVANTIELKHLLTGEKQPVPEGLIKAYPHLETIAIAEPKSELF